jgi:hypothetical protein
MSARQSPALRIQILQRTNSFPIANFDFSDSVCRMPSIRTPPDHPHRCASVSSTMQLVISATRFLRFEMGSAVSARNCICRGRPYMSPPLTANSISDPSSILIRALCGFIASRFLYLIFRSRRLRHTSQFLWPVRSRPCVPACQVEAADCLALASAVKFIHRCVFHESGQVLMIDHACVRADRVDKERNSLTALFVRMIVVNVLQFLDFH